VALLLTSVVAAAGCQGRLAYNLPPSPRLMEPGPGVGGPGPGVIPPVPGSVPYPGVYGAAGAGMAGAPSVADAGGPAMDSGVQQAAYIGGCACGGVGCNACRGGLLRGGLFGGRFRDGGYGGAGTAFIPGPVTTSQVAFLGSDGVQISWDVSGMGTFDGVPLVIPGRQDFYQGAIYRLKLTNLPGRPGVVLYPTLEIAPVTPRTDAYLAHAPIPVQFTEEDFDQALSGNFVTKVIYLPDPEFQELALAGAETLVSTRLDPGTDPIAEADRRGAILAVVRIGSKNLESGAGMFGPEQVIPASYGVQQASYNGPPGYGETASGLSVGPQFDTDVTAAQYCGPDGAPLAPNMPLGMPTAGFAPPAVPPNMIASNEWGMPISGTPIGLPGPPHIPLGTPAGLQKHVMHNKTRVIMPPPVARMDMTVKQRPGMNYPRPVTRVRVDETRREPLRLVPSWFSNWLGNSQAQDPNCY
jgi:hypothetical protein